MEFIQTIILPALYFMLPAYIANALPVISKKLNILRFLAFPVDGGKKLGNKSLFGKSKTVRGFVVGIIGALVIAYLQYLLTAVSFFNEISLVNYSLNFSLVRLLLIRANTRAPNAPTPAASVGVKMPMYIPPITAINKIDQA